MQLRIFGFSAAFIVLATLGLVLVQPPYGQPEEEEEQAQSPAPGPELLPEVEIAEPETELEIEVDEQLEPTPEELRQQAEEAQQRVAEHLEAAQRAQAEALRMQREAGLLPEEAEEEIAEVPDSMDELAQRIEELEGRLAELETMQEISDEEVALMEEELEYLEERGEFLEENRRQRLVQLDQGIAAMEQAFQALGTGDSDIDGALAALWGELGSAADNAAAYAGEEEARLSERAQLSVEAARRALANQDLYNARVALGVALNNARAARRAAETTGPNPLAP